MCRPAGADLFSCTNPPLRLRVRSPQGGLWQFQSWCTREFLPQWLKSVFSMPLYAGINACSTPPGIQQLWNRYRLFRASPPHHAKPRALPSHPAKTGQDGSPGVGAPGRRSLLGVTQDGRSKEGVFRGHTWPLFHRCFALKRDFHPYVTRKAAASKPAAEGRRILLRNEKQW